MFSQIFVGEIAMLFANFNFSIHIVDVFVGLCTFHSCE